MKSRPHLLIWSGNSVELFYLEPSQCCSTRQRACPRRLSESRANSRKLSEFHRQLAIATLVTRIFSATDLHRSNTDSAEAHLWRSVFICGKENFRTHNATPLQNPGCNGSNIFRGNRTEGNEDNEGFCCLCYLLFRIFSCVSWANCL